VKALRFVLLILYAGYLVNVGLLMVMLPWSAAWGQIIARFPFAVAVFLDAPWLRGMLSAFGVLHLLLVVWEIVSPSPSGVSRQVRSP
jgi:hypothetical protein